MDNMFFLCNAVNKILIEEETVPKPQEKEPAKAPDDVTEVTAKLNSLAISNNNPKAERRVINIVVSDLQHDIEQIVNLTMNLMSAIHEHDEKELDQDSIGFKRISEGIKDLKNMGIALPNPLAPFRYEEIAKEIVDIVKRHLNKNGLDPDIRYKDGETQLSKAFGRMNEKRMDLLISLGADINLPDLHGYTQLHHACEKMICNVEDETMVILLLNRGANPNAKNKYNNTPLFLTIKNMLMKSNFNIKIIKCLLSYGAKLDKKEIQFLWILTVQYISEHNILSEELYELTDRLIEIGADVNTVITKNGNETTFLIEIARKDILQTRKYANMGADLYTQVSYGESALSVMLKSEFKYSEQDIAKLKSPEFIESLNIDLERFKPDKHGNTLLHLFAKQNLFDIKSLGERKFGANVKNIDGDTPFHIACSKGMSDSQPFNYLIDKIDDINVVDANGNTPLMLVMKMLLNNRTNNISRVIRLLRKGAIATVENNSGETPLSLLIMFVYNQIMKDGRIEHPIIYEYAFQLFRHGIDINTLVRMPDGSSKTFLMTIIETGNLKQIKRFIDLGADINLSNENGLSAGDIISTKWSKLHLACLVQNSKEVIRLLDNGASVNHVVGFQSNLLTPLILSLHYMVQNQNYDVSIIRILLERGAEVKNSKILTKESCKRHHISSLYSEDAFDVLAKIKDYTNPILYELVRLLVKKGSDINKLIRYDGICIDSFLIRVVKARQFERIKECVDLGASVFNKDATGKSAISLMVSENSPEILSILEQLNLNFSGIDPNDIMNILVQAIEHKNFSLTLFLFQKKIFATVASYCDSVSWLKFMETLKTLHENELKFLKPLIQDVSNKQNPITGKTFLMSIALKNTYIDRIPYLVEMGANLFIKDHQGNSTFSILLEKKNPKLLEVLEQLNLDFSNFDPNESLAIFNQAIRNKDFPLVNFLFEKGGFTSIVYSGEESWLKFVNIMSGLSEDNVEIIKNSIRFIVNRPNLETGETLLMSIVLRKEAIHKILYLVEIGADLFIKDRQGNSTFSILLEKKDPKLLEILEVLEKLNLDFSNFDPSKAVDIFDQAVKSKNLKFIEFLFTKGIFKPIVFDLEKTSWLKFLEIMNNISEDERVVIEVFIADIMNQQNLENGSTFLIHVAKDQRFFYRVPYLVKTGADLYLSNYNGASALLYLIKNATDIIFFEDLNIDFKKINFQYIGESPLHVTARGNNFTIMEFFIKIGMQLTDRNIYGETTLDIAIEKYYSKKFEIIFDILNLYLHDSRKVITEILNGAKNYRECKELFVNHSPTIIQLIKPDKNPLELALILNDPRIARAFVSNLGEVVTYELLNKLSPELATYFIEFTTYDLDDTHLAHKVKAVPEQPKEEEYQIAALLDIFYEVANYNEDSKDSLVLETKLGKFVVGKEACKEFKTTLEHLFWRLNGFLNGCISRSDYAGVDDSEKELFWTNIEKAITNTIKILKNFKGSPEAVFNMKARLICEYLEMITNCGTRLDIEFDKLYFINKSESDSFSLSSIEARKPISQIEIDESQFLTAELANLISLERTCSHFNVDSELPTLSENDSQMIAEEHIFAILYDKLVHEDNLSDVVILPFGPGNIPPRDLSRLSDEVRFIIAPCSVNDNKHNTVLVIDRKKEIYFYFDSLGLTTQKEFENILANFLEAGYISHDYKHNPLHGTKQNDGWSCGFHVIENAIRAINGTVHDNIVDGSDLRKAYINNFNNFVKKVGFRQDSDEEVESFSDIIYQKLSELRRDVLESFAPRIGNSVHYIQSMLKDLISYNIPIRKTIDLYPKKPIVIDVANSYRIKYQENIFIFIKNFLKSDKDIKELFFQWLEENGRVVQDNSLSEDETKPFFDHVEKTGSLSEDATLLQRHLFEVFKRMIYSSEDLADNDPRNEIVGAYLTHEFWMIDEFEKIKSSEEDLFESLDPQLQRVIVDSGMRRNLSLFKTGSPKEIIKAKNRLLDKYKEINHIGKQVTDEDVYFLLQKFGVLKKMKQ